jgi:hypothetical protein
VEDGIILLTEHIQRLRKKAARDGLEARDFYQLDRATERLHLLQQDTDGPIPKKVLERMSPEDLDTVNAIFARYGL